MAEDRVTTNTGVGNGPDREKREHIYWKLHFMACTVSIKDGPELTMTERSGMSQVLLDIADEILPEGQS